MPALTDSEKIKAMIQYYGRSIKNFSEILELKTPQTLYDIIRGRNGISNNISHQILKKCSQINPSWLLTGMGEMTSKQNNNGQMIPLNNNDVASYVELLESTIHDQKEQIIWMQKQIDWMQHQVDMLQNNKE